MSDLSAVGVVMELQRRGGRVPEDTSIMGCGDLEIGAEISPRLTSIHVEFRGLGQTTGQLLNELLGSGAGDVPKVIDVGLKVIERASVRDAR